jgi:hypothetical protein
MDGASARLFRRVCHVDLSQHAVRARVAGSREEMEPLQTADGVWRRLAVRFPKEIATHSAVQTLYFDTDGLMKRHDYDVEISGNTPGAHLIDNYVEVSGIRFPTKRRIFARQPDGSFSTEPLVVSIALSNIRPG